MNFSLNEFSDVLGKFAARHWKPSLPEMAYQHILFHELSGLYSDQILAEMLIGVSTIRKALGADGQAIIQKYFKKQKAFSPDLIILNQTLLDSRAASLNTISKFPDGTKLAAFIELKATSSAPTRNRRSYICDTAKLQLLSNYWCETHDHRPAAIQVIFNWRGGTHDVLPPQTLRKWFNAKVQDAFPNVHVLRFDADGNCERLLTPKEP
jgi:hypothetical protein